LLPTAVGVKDERPYWIWLDFYEERTMESEVGFYGVRWERRPIPCPKGVEALVLEIPG
jgi:hypothetical protein